MVDEILFSKCGADDENWEFESFIKEFINKYLVVNFNV